MPGGKWLGLESLGRAWGCCEGGGGEEKGMRGGKERSEVGWSVGQLVVPKGIE
jgi:hypothetical protein